MAAQGKQRGGGAGGVGDAWEAANANEPPAACCPNGFSGAFGFSSVLQGVGQKAVAGSVAAAPVLPNAFMALTHTWSMGGPRPQPEAKRPSPEALTKP